VGTAVEKQRNVACTINGVSITKRMAIMGQLLMDARNKGYRRPIRAPANGMRLYAALTPANSADHPYAAWCTGQSNPKRVTMSMFDSVGHCPQCGVASLSGVLELNAGSPPDLRAASSTARFNGRGAAMR